MKSINSKTSNLENKIENIINKTYFNPTQLLINISIGNGELSISYVTEDQLNMGYSSAIIPKNFNAPKESIETIINKMAEQCKDGYIEINLNNPEYIKITGTLSRGTYFIISITPGNREVEKWLRFVTTMYNGNNIETNISTYNKIEEFITFVTSINETYSKNETTISKPN